MLKRLFLSVVCSLLCVSVFAQESRAFKKGYSGNVEVANMTIFGKDMYGARMQLGTTHGYSFGNGAFVGAGISVCYDVAISHVTYATHFDAKYNFLAYSKVSPFLAMRSGIRFNEMPFTLGNFVNVGGGVDFGRFSMRLGYEFSGRVLGSGLRSADSVFEKENSIFCSLAFMF